MVVMTFTYDWHGALDPLRIGQPACRLLDRPLAYLVFPSYSVHAHVPSGLGEVVLVHILYYLGHMPAARAVGALT